MPLLILLKKGSKLKLKLKLKMKFLWALATTLREVPTSYKEMGGSRHVAISIEYSNL
jgi:hypothetical protein